MQTEKATYSPDLPHQFADDGEGEGLCECGRSQDNELHKTHVRETASTKSTLQREQGT